MKSIFDAQGCDSGSGNKKATWSNTPCYALAHMPWAEREISAAVVCLEDALKIMDLVLVAYTN